MTEAELKNELFENAGFGFDKIENNWLEYNNTKPEYDIDFDSVVVKFDLSAEEKVGENLTNNQKEILEQMRINNKITAKELALLIGISDRKVEVNS